MASDHENQKIFDTFVNASDPDLFRVPLIFLNIFLVTLIRTYFRVKHIGKLILFLI